MILYTGYITYEDREGDIHIMYLEKNDISTIEEKYGSIVDNGLTIVAANFYQLKEV